MTLRIEELPDGVRRLTLDRPAAANALNEALHEALVSALDSAARDGTRAVLLEAAGGRVFSGGADLREEFEGLSIDQAKRRRRALLLRTLAALAAFPKPLVAFVQGKAVGAGVMLAMLADELVMAPGASLAMPEAAIGMPSPLGLAVIEARGGRACAFRLVQKGEVIGTEEALRLGLVDAVAEDARPHAARLAAIDPHAFAVNKAWMTTTLRAALPRAAEHAERAHATA